METVKFSPEFLKELEALVNKYIYAPPEWEVLKYKNIASLIVGIDYYNTLAPKYKEHYTIYSVKYKGEVFTVGDYAEISEDGKGFIKGEIAEFYIGSIQGKPGLGVKIAPLGGWLLSPERSLQKVIKDPVILTTEDGVYITRVGEEIWEVRKDFSLWQTRAKFYEDNSDGTLRFHSEEKAKEYINNHQKKFSKADIEKALGDFGNFGKWGNIMNIKIFKEKLGI